MPPHLPGVGFGPAGRGLCGALRGLVLPPCTGWGLPPCRYRPASSPPPGTVPGGLRLRGSVGASPIALGAPSPGVWGVHPTTLGLGCFPSPPGGRWGATPVTYTQGGAFPMDQEDPVPWGQRVASPCRSMGCSPTGAIRVHPPGLGWSNPCRAQWGASPGLGGACGVPFCPAFALLPPVHPRGGQGSPSPSVTCGGLGPVCV